MLRWAAATLVVLTELAADADTGVLLAGMGEGPAGVTLSWGCAADVVALVG